MEARVIERCPTCRLPILPRATQWHRDQGHACACSQAPTPKPESQRILTGLQPGRHERITDAAEKAIQQQIVDTLRNVGLLVLETSEKRRRYPCKKCGTIDYAQGGRPGVSKGLSDLLVRRRTWPHAMWLALECKARKTKLSAEQEALAAGVHIWIVRSLDDALAAIESADRDLEAMRIRSGRIIDSPPITFDPDAY